MSSSLSRLLHKFPPTHVHKSQIRTYSSFFSSKPGGGRYFNPAKPPNKVVPSASNGKRNGKQPVDGPSASTAAPPSPDNTVDATSSNDHNHSSTTNHSSVDHDTSQPASKSDSTPTTTTTTFNSCSTTRGMTQGYVHPMIGDKDFKLHQFFSLHRPLLLLSNPPSIFAPPPPPGTSIFSEAVPPQQESSASAAAVPEDLSPVPEVSYEADAETARNLTRAMTMSRLGSVVDWEATLQTLGLNSHSESERAELKEKLEKEYRDVVMDSVKRKRRKKMKKHKLKKRRRATRSQRLKMR